MVRPSVARQVTFLPPTKIAPAHSREASKSAAVWRGQETDPDDPAEDCCDDTSYCCGIVCVLAAIVLFVLFPVFWYLGPRLRTRVEMASTPFGRTSSGGLQAWGRALNSSVQTTRTRVLSSGTQALHQRHQTTGHTSVHSHATRDATRRIGPSVRASIKRKATFEAEALQNVKCHSNATGTVGLKPKPGEPARPLPAPSRPVLLFTHLRRTGGTVLEKQVLFPAIACEHGLVATQGYFQVVTTASGSRMTVQRPPSGGSAASRHTAVMTRAKPGSTISVKVHEEMLGSVLHNCHEGTLGRFAVASLAERAKFALSLRKAALVWRHCPYGVHELLPGGDLTLSRSEPPRPDAAGDQHRPLLACATPSGLCYPSSSGGGPARESQHHLLARAMSPGRATISGPPQKYLYATLLREPVERLMSWMSWCSTCARSKASAKPPADRCCGSPAVTPEPPLSNLTVYYSERWRRLQSGVEKWGANPLASPLPDRMEILLDDNYATRMLCGSSSYVDMPPPRRDGDAAPPPPPPPGEREADGADGGLTTGFTGYTRRRVGDAFGLDGRVGGEHLRCAMRHMLCEYRFVGLTARLNESVCLLARVAGWPTRFLKKHVEETGQRRADAPDDFVAAHGGLWRYDMQLFELAHELFEELLDRHPVCRQGQRPSRTTAARDRVLRRAGIDPSEAAQCGWRK